MPIIKFSLQNQAKLRIFICIDHGIIRKPFIKQVTHMNFSKELRQVINTTKGVTLSNIQDNDFSWDEFLRLTTRHGLVPLIYTNLKNSPQIPADVLLKLGQLYNVCKFRTLRNTAEVLRITRFFGDQQTKLIFVKGLPLALHLFNDPNLRPSCDIDFLVKPSNLQVATNHMTELGYRMVYPIYALEGKKLTHFLKNERHIIFEHSINKTHVEVHIKLGYPGIDYLSFDQIRPHYILYKNTNIPTLGHEDHFVFLALHGSIQAWFCLRWLYDIVKYIEQSSPSLNWQLVQELAKQYNLTEILNQTFFLANLVFGVKLPHELTSENTGKQFIHKLVKPAIQFILSDYTFGQNNKIFSQMFYTYHFSYAKRLRHGLYNKIKFLNADMIKLNKIFNKINLSDSLFFLYYILYPVAIITMFIPSERHK
jgi:hypothetical protein